MFDPNGISPVIPIDIGDSLLRLTSGLAVVDFYAPSNYLTFPNGMGPGVCKLDWDFGSGGVLVLPPAFTYNGMNVVINADKQSKLYVANQANLGKFNASTQTNLQVLLTPCAGIPCQLLDSLQGYWASPAYWEYTSGSTNYYTLYYSATTANPSATPYPISAYPLQMSGTTGPIPLTQPPLSTATLFCQYSPTPSVSSNRNQAGTGVLWAVEHGNGHNPGPPLDCNGVEEPAALHAFDATTLTELYSSRGVTTIGGELGFSTPTIFRGHVYMGTKTEVDAFGPLH